MECDAIAETLRSKCAEGRRLRVRQLEEGGEAGEQREQSGLEVRSRSCRCWGHGVTNAGRFLLKVVSWETTYSGTDQRVRESGRSLSGPQSHATAVTARAAA